MLKQYTNCIWGYVWCENNTPNVSGAICDVLTVHPLYLELYAMLKNTLTVCRGMCDVKTVTNYIWSYVWCENNKPNVSGAICDVLTVPPLYLELYAMCKQ